MHSHDVSNILRKMGLLPSVLTKTLFAPFHTSDKHILQETFFFQVSVARFTATRCYVCGC